LAQNNNELELSILACFLTEPNLLDKYIKIHKLWFYSSLNQDVFVLLKTMRHQNLPIDITTVKAKSDPFLIDKIMSSDYVVSNIDEYYKLLEDLYLSRIVTNLLDQSSKDLRESVDNNLDSKKAIDLVLGKLLDISSHHIANDTLVSVRQAGILAMEEIKNIRENGAVPFKASTDIKSFNKLCPGFSGGEMITIAGRPGSGKTAIALQFALHNAIAGVPVGFISLEMSAKDLYIRLVAFITNISFIRIKSGEITDYEWQQLVKAWNKIEKLPIFIESIGQMNDMQLKATARRMKDLYGVQALFVDYLQLIDYHGRADSRQVEVTKVSKAVKSVAMELDIPVFNLAQLNREIDKDFGKLVRPALSHLRESGAIEQDSDMVLFLYNPAKNGVVAWEDGSQTAGTMEIIIAKYRNNETGRLRVSHMPRQMKLADLAYSTEYVNSADKSDAF